MKKLCLKIADFVFSIFSNQSFVFAKFGKPYKEFICYEDPEIILKIYYDVEKEVPLTNNNRVFDSETFWKVYRIDQNPVFVLNTFSPRERPFCTAILGSDYCKGDVYYYYLSKKDDISKHYSLPFPLFNLITVSLLSKGYGVLVHACGIDDNGKGLLFLGSSGKGKSTMARLWKDEAVILNDERIILRQNQSKIWIYGTPWHGEYEKISPKGVVLDKIFFLNHGEINKITPKTGSVATSIILSHCFLPYWEHDGMQFTLDFCAKLVETVPCYELSFVPNKKSIIDFIRCVK